MASPEFDQESLSHEKFKEVKKELKLLEEAIKKQEKTMQKAEVIEAQTENVDLFIERKDKKPKKTLEKLDVSPGDHVVVKL